MESVCKMAELLKYCGEARLAGTMLLEAGRNTFDLELALDLGRRAAKLCPRDPQVLQFLCDQLTEGGEEVAATYDGVVPDLFFNPHSELVLAGEYGPSGVLAADAVLVKCPSKYQSIEYDVPPSSSF